MAYPYYPYNVNPSIYPYQQPAPQMQASQIQTPQIQSGGVVHATEEEARKYPVAPGYSVTFIDDEQKKLYTKTAGFSQLDSPVFKKYRIIEENSPENEVKGAGNTEIPVYATKAEFDALRSEFDKFTKGSGKE